MAQPTSSPQPDSPKGDAFAFNGIFAVSFVLFLAFALFAQLLMLKWRLWLPGADGEKSLIHGVRSAVYTFMSHLT